ncbi:MAG: sigma-54-dependent Fis family transcriptional regulator [Porticoccaceae bacterium]|nr:MAG: sigma-54-dependent Fis family transcriptional regulator [Porticoccaceae bacterium]
MNDAQVWIVDDDHAIRWVMEKALGRAGFRVESFADAGSLLDRLEEARPDVVVSDIRMAGIDGLDLLRTLHEEHRHLPVIITTAHSDLDSAVSAYQGGAFEYLPKPFDVDELVAVVRRAVSFAREQGGHPAAAQPPPGAEIIGEAPAMQEVFRAIGRLSRSNITVLINGESGTGKELVARALHRHSPRAQGPFIALNMAAIPHDLIESELFGHEKGAFTGAAQRRAGRFEQADGGTLFLDEIGDMPPEAQTRLLRVLAEGEFYRVGGHTPVRVNVRIIAATHQNLEELVAQHRFREDLFHRLNVIRIHLPPLRERREDIPRLIRHFLAKAALDLEVEPKVATPEVEAYLSGLDWPGNVRQLENTCRWLTVMAAGREILLSDLPPELLPREEPTAASREAPAAWETALAAWARRELAEGRGRLLDAATPTFERILLEAALEKTGGKKKEAAELLGWGRNTLTRKLRELGLAATGEED